MDNLITDTVVGAAVGSFITLVGIFISNHFHSQSRKEDREHQVKSEIFMEATEQLALTKLMLMKLPNMNMEEFNDTSATSVATAKLAVVATNATVQAVTELSTAIGEQFLRLLPEKLPLETLKTDIQILSNQLDGSFQKQNQMLNEMTAYNLRGDNDPRLWQALQDNFDHHTQQINSIIDERKQKYAHLNQLIKEFTVKCIEAAIGLSDLEVIAISNIRKELNMPFDEAHYRETINTTNAKLELEFSKFLVKIPNT